MFPLLLALAAIVPSSLVRRLLTHLAQPSLHFCLEHLNFNFKNVNEVRPFNEEKFLVIDARNPELSLLSKKKAHSRWVQQQKKKDLVREDSLFTKRSLNEGFKCHVLSLSYSFSVKSVDLTILLFFTFLAPSVPAARSLFVYFVNVALLLYAELGLGDSLWNSLLFDKKYSCRHE